MIFIIFTRAAPDSPLYTFRPPPEGPHKSLTFQHGCPHHWKPPGRMYFYNTSTKFKQSIKYFFAIHTLIVMFKSSFAYTAHISGLVSVADPGFPVGGGAPTHWGGCQPLMHTLFGKNVCENERNGSCWGGGGRRRRPLDPAMSLTSIFSCMTMIFYGREYFRSLHNHDN